MSSFKVKDYMMANAYAIKADTPLTVAVEHLSKSRLTGVPVVDADNHVVGFLSEQDCIKQLLEASYHRDGVVTVSSVMHSAVLTVSPEDNIVDLASRMITNKPKIYPVVEDDRLTGLITRGQVLRALAGFEQAQAG